jgi:dihydrofolate reductase
MGRTQYFTATSLDGYIADSDGSLEWLFRSPHGDDGSRWDRFFSGVGAMAMGATTYRWVLEHEQLLDHPEKWHDFYNDVPCWVFSHAELPRIPGADIRFVSGNVVPVHREMSSAAGDSNLWIVGGGDLVGQFQDAQLLDELHVSITPVTLGAGAPLLPRRIEGMRVVSVTQDGPRVNITYAVRD